MDVVRYLISGLMLAIGAGLAANAVIRLRRNHTADLRSWWRSRGARSPLEQAEEPSVPAPDPVEEPHGALDDRAAEPPEPEEQNPSEAAPLFVAATLQERATYAGIPLRQTGRDQHYDLETWGRMLAWLIYSRLVPGVSGRVGTPLSPTMFKGTRLDDLRRLSRFVWVRLFIDETVAQAIRSYFNLGRPELDAMLRDHLANGIESFIEPSVFAAWKERLVVRVYARDMRGDTVFDADFLPLPDNPDGTLACEAHLVVGPGLGQITYPVEGAQRRFRFADRTLSTEHGYMPLEGEPAEVIEIGPQASCHIQTRERLMGSRLTLGWQNAGEVGVAGILEIRDIEPGPVTETFVVRRADLDAAEETLLAGTRARIPENEEGKQTVVEIWRKASGSENLILTVVLRERKPPLDELPDCAVYPDGLAGVSNERDLARLLATRIYFATKQGKNETGPFTLDSDAGRAFRDDPANGPIFRRGRLREPLRCKVKLCVAPERLSLLHEQLGDRDMPRALAMRVMEVIREEPDYQEAFPADTLQDFLPGEGTPGLQIQVGADETLGGDAVLIRCLPVFVPNRRREIYGRFHFESWPEAVDLSELSCGDHLTFFTDHPPGTVALHLSRFPIFEVRVPRIFGAVKIHIIEPGTPNARLEVRNQSTTAVTVDGRQLHRANLASVEIGADADREVALTIGGRDGRLVLYGRPQAQLDEPFFVPEPARLMLYGLTAHRRLERTGWQSTAQLESLWEKAGLEENKRLLGVSRLTENGFLATVERGVQLEHHFLAGAETVLHNGTRVTLEAGSSTLGGRRLRGSCRVWEVGRENVQVDYQRIDFNNQRVRNLTLLTEDYWDSFIEEVEPLVPEGDRVTRIELVRCHPEHMSERRAHLYLVETTPEEGGDTRGWLFAPASRIEEVYQRNRDLTLSLSYESPLVGPLEDIRGRFFLVDWEGEHGTPVSFDVLCNEIKGLGLNITMEHRHSALGDAIATAHVLVNLIDRLEAIGIQSFGEAMRVSSMEAKLRFRATRF